VRFRAPSIGNSDISNSGVLGADATATKGVAGSAKLVETSSPAAVNNDDTRHVPAISSGGKYNKTAWNLNMLAVKGHGHKCSTPATIEMRLLICWILEPLVVSTKYERMC
jgi:hypothetical protein